MTCKCFIIPHDVLMRFASDADLSMEVRQGFYRSAELSARMREVRERHSALTLAAISQPFAQPPVAFPRQQPLPPSEVYDCHHTTTLPGAHVAHPDGSSDSTVKRAHAEALSVARFYSEVFQRDSIDGSHMTLLSSVHYGTHYNNAFWNGTQMTYGDGDGQVFLDFTQGNDVIGHELTHGVTQHSLALNYSGEPGGLNESMSDVFGSMFRQWEKQQTAAAADWLIGPDILGPVARKRGYTCLRNMARPQDAHALSPQPDRYDAGIGTLDPHYSSGVPNLAFAKAAVAIGGHSWEKAGQVWYKALTGFGPHPGMSMSQFANRTRSLASSMYPHEASVATAIDGAWTAVGL